MPSGKNTSVRLSIVRPRSNTNGEFRSSFAPEDRRYWRFCVPQDVRRRRSIPGGHHAEHLITEVSYGIAQGIQPLISSAYGCGDSGRIRGMLRYGLRLYFTGIPAAGQYHPVHPFTSTEQAVPAHIISLLRGLVLIIPIAFFLAGLHVSLYRVWRHLPVHAVSPPADRFLPLPWVRPGSSTVPVPCPSSAPYHTGPGHLEMLRC